MPYQPKRLDRYQVMMNNLDGMVAWDSIARIIDCYHDFVDFIDFLSYYFMEKTVLREFESHSLRTTNPNPKSRVRISNYTACTP